MNLYKQHIHLDPNPDGLGGGAAAGTPPADTGAAPAAPAFDAGAFETKMAGLVRQELGRGLGQFRSELDTRFQTNKPADSGDKAPTMKDFYNAQGEMDAAGFEKYQNALLKHHSKSERAEWEKEYESRQRQQQDASGFRKATTEHIARETEYEKANPSYRQDLLAAGDMEVNPAVGRRLLGSKYSANIIHHFAKNRGDFMRFQAASYDDPETAIEMLGELSYQFKSSENSSKPNPSAKPTRAAFGGTGAGSKPVQRPLAEIVKDWRD